MLNIFAYCSNLTSVSIPNSVTTIDGAFMGCSSLISVNIPNSVTSIGASTFYGCSSLNSLTIGNSVTSIGASAFENCTCLTSVTIPNSVNTINKFSFYGCTMLKELIFEDGNNVLSFATSSSDKAFESCPIESLYVGRNFTYDISSTYGYKSPFIRFTSIKSLIIGNYVTTIKPYAFWGCSGIESITIGKSVSSINDDAFYGCCGLKSVISLNTTPPTITSTIFDNDTYRNATLYVPEGCYSFYNNSNNWRKFYKIEELIPTEIEKVLNENERELVPKIIYALDGRRVNVKNINELSTGIYILNGKKILIK